MEIQIWIQLAGDAQIHFTCLKQRLMHVLFVIRAIIIVKFLEIEMGFIQTIEFIIAFD